MCIIREELEFELKLEMCQLNFKRIDSILIIFFINNLFAARRSSGD